MLHGGLEFELDEISQKFNFWLKGNDLGKFFKTIFALNKRLVRNEINNFKNR